MDCTDLVCLSGVAVWKIEPPKACTAVCGQKLLRADEGDEHLGHFLFQCHLLKESLDSLFNGRSTKAEAAQ